MGHPTEVMDDLADSRRKQDGDELAYFSALSDGLIACYKLLLGVWLRLTIHK